MTLPLVYLWLKDLKVAQFRMLAILIPLRVTPNRGPFVKTALIILTVGFVSLAVIVISVLSIVTSTNKGAGWFANMGRNDAPPEDPPQEG